MAISLVLNVPAKNITGQAIKAYFGSSDFGVINKIVKKQYEIPINHLADSKIITTFSLL